MEPPPQFTTIPCLNSRQLVVDCRSLWLLLAVLGGIYLSLLNLLTQTPDQAINGILIVGGAFLVFGDLPQEWQPRPGRRARWLGVALLVAVLWRGQQVVAVDSVTTWLPLLAGLALALLATPPCRLRSFLMPWMVLAFLPVMHLLAGITPLGPLSLATAWLAEQFLVLCGYPVLRQGHAIALDGGSVVVQGACAGLTMILQLLVVALIFAFAFPMRYRWQNACMVLVAPLLAVLLNALRVALLALINASGWPHKSWWFDFFHFHWGSLLFAGVAMQVFVSLYLSLMNRQVAALNDR